MGKKRARPKAGSAAGGREGARDRNASSSPMQQLCSDDPDAELLRSMADPKSLRMLALSEQFAKAVADENLEAALAMLAGCPALARLACSHALISALHYSCGSTRMAPATRALLRLGCDPLGSPRAPGQDRSGANSPMRWAASAGNPQAIQALILAGAAPSWGDLHEACRQAEGACAALILEAAPWLDPFDRAGPWGQSCDQALREAALERSSALNKDRLRVDQALAAFERWSLRRAASKDVQDDGAWEGSKRL